MNDGQRGAERDDVDRREQTRGRNAGRTADDGDDGVVGPWIEERRFGEQRIERRDAASENPISDRRVEEAVKGNQSVIGQQRQ